MVLNFLSWIWRAKRSYCSGVNLYIFPWIQYHGSQTFTLFRISVSSSLDWVLISHPSYGDLYESHYRAVLAPVSLVWSRFVLFGPSWPSVTVFPCLALFSLDPVWPFFGPICMGIVPYMTTLGAIFRVNLYSWPNKIPIWIMISFKEHKLWTRDLLLRN